MEVATIRGLKIPFLLVNDLLRAEAQLMGQCEEQDHPQVTHST